MTTVMIVAGEDSGDRLGAALMQAIKAKNSAVRIIGVGGSQMKKEGLKTLYNMQELSIMGLFEVIPKIPKAIKLRRFLVQTAQKEGVDVVVTIDNQEFSQSLLKKIKKELAIPCVHYVAPTVWAWRKRRAQKMASYVDHVLALYPFEPPYFEHVGLPCTFVGHSAVESLKNFIGTADISSHTLALLPGSRKSELVAHMPVFLETFRRLQQKNTQLKAVLPLPEKSRKALVVEAAAGKSLKDVTFVYGEERFAVLKQCRAALCKSGTANLELALLGLPMVVGFRLQNKLTAYLIQKILSVPYISPVNWVLGKKQVPEFIQAEVTPHNLTNALAPLLLKDKPWKTQVNALQHVAKTLQSNKPAAQKAADVVCSYLTS